MSKALKAALMIATVIGLLCSSAGCAKEEPADEEEVMAAARELIPAAVEVNRIFFWEGLPHEEPDEEENKIEMEETEYLMLTGDYMFLTESELMEKARAVYPEAYCEDIEKIAFEGIAVNDDEALFARYITEMGVMKINRKLSEEGLRERVPDTDTLKFESATSDSAVVSLDFVCEGRTENQSVTLKLEEAGWRLDTPTY